jgi:hypothetical protein
LELRSIFAGQSLQGVATASKGRTPAREVSDKAEIEIFGARIERERRPNDSRVSRDKRDRDKEEEDRRLLSPKNKNPRAVLPLDDAEEIWKPGV